MKNKVEIFLPRAINVQLLKFFERDLLDNIIIKRKFPHIPMNETRNMYGNEIRVRIFKTLRIVSGRVE